MKYLSNFVGHAANITCKRCGCDIKHIQNALIQK